MKWVFTCMLRYRLLLFYQVCYVLYLKSLSNELIVDEFENTDKYSVCLETLESERQITLEREKIEVESFRTIWCLELR